MAYYDDLIQRWQTSAPALTFRGKTRTYGMLLDQVDRARGWLVDRGVGPSDVLALQLPKTPQFLELHLAALSLGVTTLPLNDRLTAKELSYYLDDSQAKLLVSTTTSNAGFSTASPSELEGWEGPAAPAIEVDPDSIAVLCYTSGTTGPARGACIRDRNLQAGVEALHSAWRWTAADRLLHALPHYHVHGLFVAQHGAMWAGAHSHWCETFDAPTILQQLEQGKHTVFMGVPTFYHRFLKSEGTFDLKDVRLFTSGSAPLQAKVHRQFHDRFGHTILERYGMTEVGIVLSNPYDGERRPGAVGFPLRGVRARVVHPETREPVETDVNGELQIGGATVFAGYLGRPEATAAALQDGWMNTGDRASQDSDGYFRITGRSKDLIIVGGLNVSPREVEAVLLELQGVDEVAVVGVQDEDLGEVPWAVIVGEIPPDEVLMAHCKRQLSGYKRPRGASNMQSLPRNSMGKVQKHVLRRKLRAQLSPLPLSEEIRAARQEAHACSRAAELQSRVIVARIELQHGVPLSDPTLLADLGESSPTLEALDSHVARLSAITSTGPSLAHRLEHLQHDQQDALKAPEWSDRSEELIALGYKRDAVLGKIRPLADEAYKYGGAMRASLPMAQLLRDRASQVQANNALAIDHLLESTRQVLDLLRDLPIQLPAAPIPREATTPEQRLEACMRCIEHLESEVRSLTRKTDELDTKLAGLQTELEEFETQIMEELG